MFHDYGNTIIATTRKIIQVLFMFTKLHGFVGLNCSYNFWNRLKKVLIGWPERNQKMLPLVLVMVVW